MKICFATHNNYKLIEIQKLAPESIELVSLSDLGLNEDIPETGKTLEENADIKASYVFEKLGIACFADDSGLEVKALNGDPGVYSARYAGLQKNDDDNMALLLKNLQNKTDKEAAFKTVITFIDENGNKNRFAGIAEGTIISEKRGTMGFGYDPIFVPKGYEKTFAEMTSHEKNAISHRGKAFGQFITYLATL